MIFREDSEEEKVKLSRMDSSFGNNVRFHSTHPSFVGNNNARKLRFAV